MKDLYKIKSGKRVNVEQAVNEFLDSEIETFRKNVDLTQASEKSIKTMGFKIVSDDIHVVYGKSDTTNTLVPYLLVCIAKLDDKYYGAYYDPKNRKRYCEELRLDFMLNVIESVLIEDQQEWLVVSNFFNLNNVFEKSRIMDWYLSYRTDQIEDLKKVIEKMEWFQQAKKHQAKKGKRDYTPEEVISLMPTVSQILNMNGTLSTPRRKRSRTPGFSTGK